MKIIGHAGNHSIIVELGRNEMARLMGVCNESSIESPDPRRNCSEKLPVGMVVDVSAMYNRLKAQERAAAQLKSAGETLSALAAVCVATVPQIESLGPEVQS